MSRGDKEVRDKYVAKPKSQPHDKYDRDNTPAHYDLEHATPSRLSQGA